MMGTFRKICRSAACLVCAAAAWNSSVDFIGTEFSGGRITGPVLNASLIGAFLLVLAMIATFIWPRVAATGALVACALCFPMYFYRTLPSFFVRISGGEWADPPKETFVWHGWSIVGLAASALVAYLCYRSLVSSRRRSS